MIDQSAATIYEIADGALPDFLARIATLSKKSLKLLGKPIVPEFHGEVSRPYTAHGRTHDLDGNPYILVFHRVSVTAETPKINGWTFVATIDHTHAAGNLIRSVPGAGELPERFRTAAPFCEHCATHRYRKETFVLRGDNGDYKQIGRQCTRDFIGHDVKQITEMASWLCGLEPSESDGEGGYGGGQTPTIFLSTYLAHVNAIIRTVGWVSRKDAEIRQTQATASAALINMFPPRKSDRPRGWEPEPLTEKDRAIGHEALGWAQALAAKPNKSDYEYNLSVIAQEPVIDSKATGLAASMVPGLFRHQEQALKRAARLGSLRGSQHIGTVGERLKDVTALVYGHRAFDGQYGATHMFHMRTPDGNVLVWFASGEQDFERGDTVVLTGTVKKLDEFEGVKQTVLSRCKVVVKRDDVIHDRDLNQKRDSCRVYRK
jgi:hypothetical protein